MSDTNSDTREDTGADLPDVDRRTFLKGAGVAGAMAVAGPSAAQHAAQPVTAQTSDGVGYGYTGADSSRAASMMMMVAPIGTGFSTAATVDNAGGDFADWFIGTWEDEIDRSDQQLILDCYSQGRTVQENFRYLLKQNYNSLELAENDAIADAKWAVANHIKNGKTKSATGLAAREAVLESYAVYQENFLKALEAALSRLQHIRELEVDHPDVESPTIWYDNSDQNTLSNVTKADIFGLKDLTVELLDGRTIETKGLIAGAPDSNALEYWIHPYFSSRSDTSGKVLSEYVQTTVDDQADTLQRLFQQYRGIYDSDRRCLYIEEYDSNNGWFSPLGGQTDVMDGVPYTDNNDQEFSYYIQQEIHDRALTLANEAQTLGEELYDQYQAGEINLDNIVDPYVQAQQSANNWRQTGHHGYAAATAMQLGYASDISKTMTVDWYDTSENSTQELSGTLLPSPRVATQTVTKTAEFTEWTYDSNLDVGTTVSEDALAQRTGHTVTWTDSGGSTYTLTEGNDYTDKLGKGAITIPSSSNQVSAEEGTVTVEINAEMLQSQSFNTGNTYTVEQDGDYLFAVQGGLKQFDSGDEFTVKSLYNASGEEINTVSTDPGNIQTLNTQQILDRLRRIEEANKRLNQTNPPSGGGGGGGDGGGTDLVSLFEENLVVIAAVGAGILATLSVVLGGVSKIIDAYTPW